MVVREGGTVGKFRWRNWPVQQSAVFVNIRRSIFLTLLVACLAASFFQCKEKIADSPIGNSPPRTYLWLYPDPPESTVVDTGISRRRVHWWAEDPDGLVRGYLFGFVRFRNNGMLAPDTVTYTWTTKNDTTIRFPLDTLFRYFTVFVRAVDDQFPGLPERSRVRLVPTPVADTSGLGVFDQPLARLTGAMDPRGAFLVFPVRNTPPTITFAQNPNDPTNLLRLPDYTYTVVSIGFKGYDPDGDETLAEYRIALNDTSNPGNWMSVRTRDTVVTLVVPRERSDAAPNIPGAEVVADVYSGKFLGGQVVGQLPGLRLDTTNVFFVQARDVAGEYSSVIRIPTATQSAWFVKRPRGKVLLVQDYTDIDSTSARTAYLTGLHGIPDPVFATIDELNITPAGFPITEKQAGRVSRMVPPYIDPTMIRTFLLYDYVILFTDAVPTLGVIQAVPFYYLQNGGKMLLSMKFSADFSLFNPTAILREFAPVDSVASVFLGTPHPFPSPGDNRIRGASKLHPDSSIAGNIYPGLVFIGTRSTIHSFFWRDMYRRTDGRVIYRLEPDSLGRYNAVDPGGNDTARPKVAIVDGQGKIVIFGLPMHLLTDTANPSLGLMPLFRKMFTEHFSARHRIDRRKY
jgi:hypothetical protein